MAAGGSCSLQQDDDGANLWLQDHDSNESIPLACASDNDPHLIDPYGPYAYDAVFALAHVLHELIEVQRVTTITGTDLMAALVSTVRFEGATGTVDFVDASSSSSLKHHGDRQSGVRYDLVNFQGSSAGLVRVGRWQPCREDLLCTWPSRWARVPGVPLVYSTADGTKPEDVALPSCNFVEPVAFCMRSSPGIQYNHSVVAAAPAGASGLLRPQSCVGTASFAVGAEATAAAQRGCPSMAQPLVARLGEPFQFLGS